MSLTLHSHPLASFCWKVLIALYESDLAFKTVLVELDKQESRDAFFALWPMGKMPVLRDDDAGVTLPETTIILEHLAATRPQARWLLPEEPDRAIETRLRDRFYDAYVQEPMQKIVIDRLRPAASRDPFGVAQARATLKSALNLVETRFAPAPWACGGSFSMADCAAMPALFYANEVAPFATTHPRATAYLAQVSARPSVARVLAEAGPYLVRFPREPAAE